MNFINNRRNSNKNDVVHVDVAADDTVNDDNSNYILNFRGVYYYVQMHTSLKSGTTGNNCFSCKLPM